HEYGPETDAGSVEENRMLRERLKRAQIIHPIVRSVPAAGSTSRSASGSWSAEMQQRQGYRGGAADLKIDVDNNSQVESSQMTTSSLATMTTNNTNCNSVQLIPMIRLGHGHGHGHGQVPRRPRRPHPVSEGVYGPDTFQESLEAFKNVPERPRGWRAKLMAIVQQHWKTWLCVGSMFVAAIVLPLTLNKKKGDGSDSKAVASAGQVSDGGDDLGLEGAATTVMTTKEPSGGSGKTTVTKTATPSFTRSIKSTPSSISISASTTSPSKSSAALTSKAATVRRSTTTRTSTRRRSRLVRTTTSRSSSRTVAPTRTSTPTKSSA
ncbi:hypothetical protein BG015_002779, partial [Linnemannia schmuckeri]